MTTASARPEALADLDRAVRRAAAGARDALDAVASRRRIAAADLAHLAVLHGADEQLARGAELRAQAAVQQVEALARAVGQVAEAFAAADRGTLGSGPLAPPGAPPPAVASDAGLAEAIQLLAPGLLSVVAGAPLTRAHEIGRRAATLARRALASADPAVRTGSALDAVDALAQAGGDDAALRAAVAAFLDDLEGAEFEALINQLCADEWQHGPATSLGVLAMALSTAAAGPPAGPARLTLDRRLRELQAGVPGRNALRVLLSAGLALPPRSAATVASSLLVRSSASTDLGQGAGIAPDTDPLSVWLGARHGDGDEPALLLLGSSPAAVDRFLGPEPAGVADRIERLIDVADRPGAQRALVPVLLAATASARSFDPDGTVSAHGRAIARGAVVAIDDPTAVGEPLAEAFASMVLAHPDAYESLAAGTAPDRAALDRHLQAITQHPWPTVVASAGLMDHRRRTMAATLHDPFERRTHTLAPSAGLHAALERAAASTDRVEVDTTVFAVARSLVPLATKHVAVALGGGPLAAGATLAAQLVATTWIDEQRDRHRARAGSEPAVPLLDAARAQVRLDAWRVIAADPTLGAELRRVGSPGDPTAPGAPLQPHPDALAEWEQAQPAPLRDLVATYAAAFEGRGAGTGAAPVGD